MFILRIIEEELRDEALGFANKNQKVVENHSLGEAYAKFVNGESREFDQIMNNQYPDVDKEGLSAVISSQLGDVWFIEKDTENKRFSYFIMTESGKTFERLS